MKKRLRKTDLTLIILSYNTQFWLKKTLETLKEFYLDKAKYNIETIVVDNGSTDGSVEMVKKNISWVELIETGENLGFAGGNNVALKKVESRYAMLLNSDLEFKPESNLDILVEYMDKHPKTGAITPKIEFVNGKIDPACHRGEPTLWASLTYFAKLESLFPKSRTFGQYHQSFKDLGSHHTIDACSGATLMVRKSAMDKVGFLDDRFFMYAEDLDWCRRFRDKDYEIVYHPQVKIVHHKYKSGIKSSSKKIAKTTNKYFYDTMLAYYDKHYVNKYPKFIRTLIRYYINIKKEGF
ncbi:glycosyltransferase family 2 protein [Patescibacteria group bacterium]|nr:glycosyltransferase family 2 protein [Patescibacteria group bacterium]